MTRRRVAVIVRAQDGEFQPIVLSRPAPTVIYQLRGCVLRRTVPQGAARSVSSIAEMAEDLFVFINVPLETVNHLFLDAVLQAIDRKECGLASGLVIDDKRRILHSGWEMNAEGVLRDPYAGQTMAPTTVERERSVAGISDYFFAVRRRELLRCGGLTAVSSERMPQLVRRLTDAAHAAELKVLVTPFALATVTESFRIDAELGNGDGGAL